MVRYGMRYEVLEGVGGRACESATFEAAAYKIIHCPIYLLKWSEERGADVFDGDEGDGPRRVSGNPTEVDEEDADAGAGSSSSESAMRIGFLEDMKKYSFRSNECLL